MNQKGHNFKQYVQSVSMICLILLHTLKLNNYHHMFILKSCPSDKPQSDRLRSKVPLIVCLYKRSTSVTPTLEESGVSAESLTSIRRQGHQKLQQ